MLLGLALAVLCEGVSMEAEVAMIEVAPASALQAAEKKMAEEGFDLKGESLGSHPLMHTPRRMVLLMFPGVRCRPAGCAVETGQYEGVQRA